MKVKIEKRYPTIHLVNHTNNEELILHLLFKELKDIGFLNRLIRIGFDPEHFGFDLAEIILAY